MPSWKNDPVIEDAEKLPPLDPPPIGQIDPVHPDWARWIRVELGRLGHEPRQECLIGILVEPTGREEDRPVEGNDPGGFDYDTGGWTADEEQETVPPAPYQDFTRWRRTYRDITIQHCVQYQVTIRMQCPNRPEWRSPPRLLWKAVGEPKTGERDTFTWTITSGLRQGADGEVYKWRTAVKAPPDHREPFPVKDHLKPHRTPSFAVSGAPRAELDDPKASWAAGSEYRLREWSPWTKFGDLDYGDKTPKTGEKKSRPKPKTKRR